MQTILYSTTTTMRNYVYRYRINHTVYSAREFEINYYPIRKHLATLHTHDLIIVSDDANWVKYCINQFKTYHIKYRLINDTNDTKFKSMQTIDLKKPFDLIPLVYYEQTIKPVIYLSMSRGNKKNLLNDVKRNNASIIYISGTSFNDINSIPIFTQLTTQFIQLKLSIILPCNNPGSFLDDATNRLCLLANPSSPNPLTQIYDLKQQKWIKLNFNHNKIQLPLIRLNSDELKTEYNSGKYTIYAVEIGEL